MSSSDRLYELLAKIPRGKVTTYKELAKAVGKPRASRAIGQILNKNPKPVVIPCHRVVKSNGDVGGYAYGSRKKVELLENEGVKISRGKILDFDEVSFRF
ncbi:MAG: MGMT family protein [Nitrososphaerales archaeon]